MELERILYVEDDDDIRNIAEMVITMGGIQVASCNGGEEALKILENDVPQLAVVDVMMPGMDGIMLFKKIRELCFDFPIIFMTAKTQKDEVDRYYELGAAGVISKPFNPEELVSQIKEIYKKTVQ